MRDIKVLHPSNLLSEVISTKNLNTAFESVYRRRKKCGYNNDIWSVSLHWDVQRKLLQTQLLQGSYQLSPIEIYVGTDGSRVTQWSTRDAMVLKALSQILAPIIGEHVGIVCHHLKDNGGIHGAVQKVNKSLSTFKYVIRSDVSQFYDSMQHDIVLSHCGLFIKDKRILALISQYLNRCEVFEGRHYLINQGIPKGCPLSPLMGAIMLKSLDSCIPDNAAYARYMDDWVILLKTRSQVRRMVKKMHRVMLQLKFKLALDKTYIGRIQNGFDFLGYRFNHKGIIGLAKKTIQNFFERIAKLYEQGADKERIRLYVQRWLRWVVITA